MPDPIEAAYRQVQKLVESLQTGFEVFKSPEADTVCIRDTQGSGEALRLRPDRLTAENGELSSITRTRIISYLASRQS